MILNIFLLIIGFVLLVKGADFFVDGASGLAARFKIPDLIIGLTIVAMGTSAPEAAVSITAAFDDSADITIGNIVGSNILNVFIILGIASLLISIKVAPSTLEYEIPFMCICSGILLLMGLDGEITLLNGIILCILFLIYLTYLFISAKRSNSPAEKNEKQRKLWLELVMIIGGLVILLLGSKLAVSSASSLARSFGISERFIGLTIVALGTSLPELFTSVIAAKKGNADIAVGNIVGSNIFNILFVVGITSLITDVPFASKFIIDSIFMIAAAVMLFLCALKNKAIGKKTGIIFLSGYIIYFIYLCLG